MNSILFIFLILSSGDAQAIKVREFDTHKECLVAAENLKENLRVPADVRQAVIVCAHNNAT